jgi:CheY-like chemotaxis protein
MQELEMQHDVVIELIRILPTLLWVGLVISLMLIFRRPILDNLIPRLSGLSAFGVEATFVKEELDRAAEQADTGSEQNRSQVARRAERLSPILEGARVLLVNDFPQEMHHVVKVLEALKIAVTIAKSTTEALDSMSRTPFDVVISDMRRGDNASEGIAFLEESIRKGLHRPTIFTVGAYDPRRGTPPFAFGITNRVDELVNLVFDALERQRA